MSVDASRRKRPLSECDNAWRIVEDELGAVGLCEIVSACWIVEDELGAVEGDGNSVHCLFETDEMRPTEDTLEGDDDGLSMLGDENLGGDDDGLCTIDEKTGSEKFAAAPAEEEQATDGGRQWGGGRESNRSAARLKSRSQSLIIFQTYSESSVFAISNKHVNLSRRDRSPSGGFLAANFALTMRYIEKDQKEAP